MVALLRGYVLARKTDALCFLFTHCWATQRWRLKAGGDTHATHSIPHFASINQFTHLLHDKQVNCLTTILRQQIEHIYLSYKYSMDVPVNVILLKKESHIFLIRKD